MSSGRAGCASCGSRSGWALDANRLLPGAGNGAVHGSISFSSPPAHTLPMLATPPVYPAGCWTPTTAVAAPTSAPAGAAWATARWAGCAARRTSCPPCPRWPSSTSQSRRQETHLLGLHRERVCMRACACRVHVHASGSSSSSRVACLSRRMLTAMPLPPPAFSSWRPGLRTPPTAPRANPQAARWWTPKPSTC